MSKNNVENEKENVQEVAKEIISEVQETINNVVDEDKPKKGGFLKKVKKFVIPALCFVGGVAAKTIFDTIVGGNDSVADLPVPDGASSVTVADGVQTVNF